MLQAIRLGFSAARRSGLQGLPRLGRMAWGGIAAAAVAAVGLTGLAIFGTDGLVHAQSIPSYSARSGLPSFHLVQPTSTISPMDALNFYGSPGAPGHVAPTPPSSAYQSITSAAWSSSARASANGLPCSTVMTTAMAAVLSDQLGRPSQDSGSRHSGGRGPGRKGLVGGIQDFVQIDLRRVRQVSQGRGGRGVQHRFGRAAFAGSKAAIDEQGERRIVGHEVRRVRWCAKGSVAVRAMGGRF
jgi:hypothetical protein